MIRKWEKKEIDLMIKYSQAGMTARDIGKKLNRTKNAIIGKMRRTGQKLYYHKKIRKISVLFNSDKSEKQFFLLKDLKANQCHFPVNEGGPYLFCGEPVHSAHPYCLNHCLVSYLSDSQKDLTKSRHALRSILNCSASSA